MSITYVNIGGATCRDFTEQKPADIPDIILYNAGGVLKATDFSIVSVPIGATVTTIGSNALTASDFQFTARFDDSVVFGSPAKPNARVLFKTGSTPDNTKFGESTNWSTNGSTVTYKDGTNYTIQLSSTTTLNNLLGEYLPTLTPGSPVRKETPFYLRKYEPTGSAPSVLNKIYLARDLSLKDIDTASVAASDITNKETFIFVIKGNDTRKFFGIQRADNLADLPNLVVVYDSTKNPNYYVMLGSDSYCIDTVTPTDEQIATSVTTLIKNQNTGKFLSLSSTGITSSSFMFNDYWTSGLTKEQIQERLMFKWFDLTPSSTVNPAPGSTEDIYHWGIIDTTQGSQVTRYINVYSTSGGSLAVGNTSTRPPLNEGWAFSFLGSNTQGALVYRQANTELGYINPTDVPTFVALSPGNGIPSTANVFICVKCSNFYDNGLCRP